MAGKGGEALAQFLGEGALRFAEGLAASARVVRGSIGGAAAGGAHQLAAFVAEPQKDHAMVKQGRRHGEERAFLAAVEAGGAGEDPGGLIPQGPLHPKAAALVEKVFERRGHVAKAGGGAQRQRIAVCEVLEAGVGRALGGFRGSVTSVAGATGGTVRIFASPPARATPRATCFARAAVLPLSL